MLICLCRLIQYSVNLKIFSLVFLFRIKREAPVKRMWQMWPKKNHCSPLNCVKMGRQSREPQQIFSRYWVSKLAIAKTRTEKLTLNVLWDGPYKRITNRSKQIQNMVTSTDSLFFFVWNHCHWPKIFLASGCPCFLWKKLRTYELKTRTSEERANEINTGRFVWVCCIVPMTYETLT